MATAKQYQAHMKKHLDKVREIYENTAEHLVLKMEANLNQNQVNDLVTRSLPLRQLTKAKTITQVFADLTPYIIRDDEGLQANLSPEALLERYEQGEEEIEIYASFCYSGYGSQRTACRFHMVQDPATDDVLLFFYLLNRSYEWVVQRGLTSLKEQQNYWFHCIDAESGRFITFPSTNRNRGAANTLYDESIRTIQPDILKDEKEVMEELALPRIIKALSKVPAVVVSFSRMRGGKPTHQYYRYTYMDKEHQYILLARHEITDIVSQNPVSGEASIPGDFVKHLAFEYSRPHTQRAVHGLNEVLGMVDEGGPETDYSGYRVLLAEDHEINVEVARSMLEGLGFEVEVAVDGQKALDKFKDAPEGYYDCLLLDAYMPEKDGFEAARSIRKLKRTDAKTVPIVAMLATIFEDDIKKAEKAGMSAHLTKPLNPKRLADTLDQLLGSKRRRKKK